MIPKAQPDNSGVDMLEKLLKVHNKEALDLAYETFKDLQQQHLDEIRQQPRVRSYPADYPGGQLPFDTEKQRRWYWANIGEPHKRTGELVKGVMEWVFQHDFSVEVVASYENKSTKYVLGNILGEDVESFQQRFHKATGWQPVAPKLEKHGQNYNDTFVRRYDAFIAFYRG